MPGERARYETNRHRSIAKQLHQKPALLPFVDDGYQAPTLKEIFLAIEHAGLAPATGRGRLRNASRNHY